MDAWGGVNVVFFAASIAAGGALLLGLPRLRRMLPAVANLIVFAGLFATFAHFGVNPIVPIANDPNKDMQAMLADPNLEARVIESQWSSFGRTDLVASDLTPNKMTIFVDGAAGSPMFNMAALLRDRKERMQFEMHSGKSFRFPLLKAKEKRSALILGPGGGRDVAVALLGGCLLYTSPSPRD